VILFGIKKKKKVPLSMLPRTLKKRKEKKAKWQIFTKKRRRKQTVLAKFGYKTRYESKKELIILHILGYML
jgi:hypothetical protein